MAVGFPTKGWTPYTHIGAGSNNATVLKNSPGLLGHVSAFNISGSIIYLKFYDKASAPDPSADDPVLVYPIPANTAVGGLTDDIAAAYEFKNGVAFAMVANIAIHDNTNIAANVSTINLGYK